MPEETEKGGSSKSLDRLLKGLDAMMMKVDAMGSRLDAMDKARADAEEEVVEKKDPPEVAEKKAPPPPAPAPPVDAKQGEPVPVAADKEPIPPQFKKADETEEKPKLPPEFLAEKKEEKAADSTGDLNALRKRLAELETRMPKFRTDHDLSADQAAADSVYSVFGESAPRPLIGDSRASYVLRNLEHFKQHSPQWKGVDLTPISVDEKVLDIAADQIYAAARSAAANPANVPAGSLRAITTRSPTGHLETKFMGSPSAWMNRHAPNKRFVSHINLKKD